MSSQLSRRFVVHHTDTSECAARASRRLIINADIAKASKLCAGDVVALLDHDNAKDTKVGRDCVTPDGVIITFTLRTSQYLTGLRRRYYMAVRSCGTRQ